MKHSHYFKKTPYEFIDVYRVLELFNVTNPSIAHAVKKLLVAGNRGHKDLEKDVQEAIDSLLRWQEMRKEDARDIFNVKEESSGMDKQIESSDIRNRIMNEIIKQFDDNVIFNGESD